MTNEHGYWGPQQTDSSGREVQCRTGCHQGRASLSLAARSSSISSSHQPWRPLSCPLRLQLNRPSMIIPPRKSRTTNQQMIPRHERVTTKMPQTATELMPYPLARPDQLHFIIRNITMQKRVVLISARCWPQCKGPNRRPSSPQWDRTRCGQTRRFTSPEVIEPFRASEE